MVSSLSVLTIFCFCCYGHCILKTFFYLFLGAVSVAAVVMHFWSCWCFLLWQCISGAACYIACYSNVFWEAFEGAVVVAVTAVTITHFGKGGFFSELLSAAAEAISFWSCCYYGNGILEVFFLLMLLVL